MDLTTLSKEEFRIRYEDTIVAYAVGDAEHSEVPISKMREEFLRRLTLAEKPNYMQEPDSADLYELSDTPEPTGDVGELIDLLKADSLVGWEFSTDKEKYGEVRKKWSDLRTAVGRLQEEKQELWDELIGLRTELHELRKDRERLEWLIKTGYNVWSRSENRETTDWYCGRGCPQALPAKSPRQAIDDSTKEADDEGM